MPPSPAARAPPRPLLAALALLVASVVEAVSAEPAGASAAAAAPLSTTILPPASAAPAASTTTSLPTTLGHGHNGTVHGLQHVAVHAGAHNGTAQDLLKSASLFAVPVPAGAVTGAVTGTPGSLPMHNVLASAATAHPNATHGLQHNNGTEGRGFLMGHGLGLHVNGSAALHGRSLLAQGLYEAVLRYTARDLKVCNALRCMERLRWIEATNAQVCGVWENDIFIFSNICDMLWFNCLTERAYQRVDGQLCGLSPYSGLQANFAPAAAAAAPPPPPLLPQQQQQSLQPTQLIQSLQQPPQPPQQQPLQPQQMMISPPPPVLQPLVPPLPQQQPAPAAYNHNGNDYGGSIPSYAQ